MRTEISKAFTFEAAHRLPRVGESHKCSRLHGHSYTVTVTVSGPVDADLGWVLDFGELDGICRLWTVVPLDHRCLNDIEGLENPTSEVLAAWIFRPLSEVLDGAGVVLECVEVSETCTSAARVRRS